jgi:hypothetical protein
MLSLRKTYAGRIKHPDDVTEPATLDPLSAIAPLFRARPEIQGVCRFALQWEVVHEAEPAGFAQFHIVRGKSSTSKLNTRVRFPSPAPAVSTRLIAKGCAASSDHEAHMRGLPPFALRSPELFRDPACGELTERA